MEQTLTQVAVVAVYLAFGVVALPRFREEYGELRGPVLVVLFLLGPFAFVFGDLVVDLGRRWRRRRQGRAG